VDLTPAQHEAIASLAQSLGLPVEQVRLVSAEAVTWPDGCMGVRRLGVLCTQAQVSGFRILLEAQDKQYEFHTNQDGSVIVPEGGLQVSGPALEAVLKQLAMNLGVREVDVQAVSSSSTEWPDGCLGVALEGVMCAQVVTPGYLIVLEAAGRQYEYHTDDAGSRVMPATLAMSWRQEGGIAGLCRSLTVYRSGEVYGIDCRTASDGRMGTLISLLSTTERGKFYQWLDSYGNVVADLSDPPNVMDRLSRNLDFYGSGNKQPALDVQQEIFSFGQSLYQKLYQ
jgi:hypothetical protein